MKTKSEHTVLFLRTEDLQCKLTYSKEVYQLLEDAYGDCGGINKGSGFKNAEEMVEKITSWRLTFKNGKLITVMMFKEKGKGLKMVAYAPLKGIDPEIRESDLHFMLNNSYAELSGALLVIVLKFLGSKWKKYLLNANKIFKADEIIKLRKYCKLNPIPKNSEEIYARINKDWTELLNKCYLRNIGNEFKMKVLMGKL